MKKLAIACVWVALAVACGHKSNEPASLAPKAETDSPWTPEAKSKTFRVEYRLSESECSTRFRVALSAEELCLNLQIDKNNNECARKARQDWFGAFCKGQDWNSDIAVHELEYGTGSVVTCRLSPLSGLDGEGAYALEQSFNGGQMEMRHETARALIRKHLQEDKLRLELYLLNSDRVVLAEETQEWPSKSEKFNLATLESSELDVRLDCRPLLRKRIVWDGGAKPEGQADPVNPQDP